MKLIMSTVCLAAFIQVACVVAADGPPVQNDSDLPLRVGIHDIDQSIRAEVNKLSGVDVRAAYLASVAASNTPARSQAENFRKASAIRLLGVIKSTNVIRVLVTNVTFVDLKYNDRPAVEALAGIGEPTVPYLLDVLKDDAASEENYECAVKALMLVKKANVDLKGWIAFIKNQRDRLPQSAGDRLWKYGSIQD